MCLKAHVLKVWWSHAIAEDKLLDHGSIHHCLYLFRRRNWKGELFLCQYCKKNGVNKTAYYSVTYLIDKIKTSLFLSLYWFRISCIWELTEEKEKSGCWDLRQEQDMLFKGTCSITCCCQLVCFLKVPCIPFIVQSSNLFYIYQSSKPWYIHKGDEESHATWKQGWMNK